MSWRKKKRVQITNWTRAVKFSDLFWQPYKRGYEHKLKVVDRKIWEQDTIINDKNKMGVKLLI